MQWLLASTRCRYIHEKKTIRRFIETCTFLVLCFFLIRQKIGLSEPSQVKTHVLVCFFYREILKYLIDSSELPCCHSSRSLLLPPLSGKVHRKWSLWHWALHLGDRTVGTYYCCRQREKKVGEERKNPQGNVMKIITNKPASTGLRYSHRTGSGKRLLPWILTVLQQPLTGAAE